MASFWDKVKSWLGGGAPPSEEAAPERPLPPNVSGALAKRVEAEVVRRVAGKQPFEPITVAGAVLAETGDAQSIKALVAASSVIDWLHDDGRLEPLGYMRTKQASGNWLYHPVGWTPSTAPPPQPARVPQPAPSPAVAAPRATPAPAPAKAPAKKVDPFAAPGILGLSAAELRKRAMRIDPYRTAWIGRTDTIPPQSDERTAIIDRGLILRGLLTEKQIEEIHRVGDLWLRHHEAAKLAASLAQGAAERAVADAQRARAEKKAQKKREAEARAKRRAADITRRKKEDIVFLGAGVSKGLADRRSHVEALLDHGLPVLSTPADVARALGITVSELRFLAFHAEATEKPHYVTFEIPKRSGGKRRLAAPMPRLARAQAWVLHEVLEKLPTEEPAHGFIKGRSTVTCARPHVGHDLVVNLDLSDFFPTITFGRVRGVFQRVGYSPAVATVLALLCTESPRARVEYDGKRYHAAVGPRALPQGACTSPAISNQVARKLDRRLAGMARKHGLTYTRYADDLTFSGGKLSQPAIGMLLARVRHVVTEEGFAVNPKKGRVQRASGRQTVTGIVVNDRPSVPREEVRRLRAILHHAEKTGLPAQNRAQIPHFEAHLRGKLAYLHMVDPERAAPLIAQLEAIAARAS
jgi:retron-type reverse transcriptase